MPAVHFPKVSGVFFAPLEFEQGAALRTMRDRIRMPHHSPREILLDGEIDRPSAAGKLDGRIIREVGRCEGQGESAA